MEKFTFLELHLNDEVSFSNVIGSDADEEAEAATDGGTAAVAADAATESEPAAEDASGGAPNPLLLLAGFVALVLVAVVVRNLLGDDAADEFEPEMVELEE
ncbi:hypothetical protein [Haloarchaeobius sp. HME9146]|uniref:hypothetical protein n=1 Tax=Haloarchaeobius sp. HME9146 TaxID=2978732 RepID=UPI0021BE8919|nr:hypothetical protein [Haloarchaeobius sp. HME9146]MCT9097107.1 hypothetical protein [Haloarchaeobius sp. HME9146]